MVENGSKDENGDSSHPPKHMQEFMRRQRQPRRLGQIPGAGPKGSPMVTEEELPDDTEALKHLYLELQRQLRDTEARRHHDIERQRLFGGDDDTLEDLLGHFWDRGMEFIFIGGVLITIISLLIQDISLTSPAVLVATLLSAWERYLREPVNTIGGAIQGGIEQRFG